MSMEARMTMCNMSIEAGARAGMVAPDDTTFAYLKGREHAPTGEQWDAAVAAWRELRTDDDAEFDPVVAHRRRRADARSSPGAPTPGRASRSRSRSPTPSRSTTTTPTRPARRSPTWA